ncbi:tRNA pseudouridine(13) synthase TruD [Candidatus Woesearchaeota archaeon]|nr:tRNA pseudouridine(13) synthase TruD [Candidatus Woesearchaeota archaeon]
MSYKLKQIPEDFVVNEIFNFKSESGPYGVFLLKKTCYTTTRAIRIVSRFVSTSLKNIGYAGLKDKNAVTTQYISIKNCKKEVKIDNLKTEFLGNRKEPISLGDHQGNHFEITVRNIKEKPEIKAEFINYFGEQRFSINNVEIGKAMLKKEWVKACELINQKEVTRYLQENPNNPIDAIKLLPIKINKLFIAAYQSYLWNATLQTLNSKPQTLMVPGFGVEINEKMLELMKQDGITERDFIIREIPQLTLEGVERKVFVQAKNLETSELLDDELNKGKKKIVLKFDLPNGCYATEFVRQLFEN